MTNTKAPGKLNAINHFITWKEQNNKECSHTKRNIKKKQEME